MTDDIVDSRERVASNSIVFRHLCVCVVWNAIIVR